MLKNKHTQRHSDWQRSYNVGRNILWVKRMAYTKPRPGKDEDAIGKGGALHYVSG